MTINWKQGLVTATLLMSLCIFTVGCSKEKSDKAVADKSSGEIVGEEIDIVEVVPNPSKKQETSKEQTENQKSDTKQNPEAKQDKPESQTTPTMNAPVNNTPEAPTAPATPTENTAQPSTTTSDSLPRSTSTEVQEGESFIEEAVESETVFGHHHRGCCSCVPACVTPCAPVCAPVCTPACAPCPPPVCTCCPPCCRISCCKVRHHGCCRVCLPYCTLCMPSCGIPCAPACSPSTVQPGCPNGGCSVSWPDDVEPTDSTAPANESKKTVHILPSPDKTTSSIQTVTPSTAVGSAPTKPESPVVALPEAK